VAERSLQSSLGYVFSWGMKRVYELSKCSSQSYRESQRESPESCVLSGSWNVAETLAGVEEMMIFDHLSWI